jgi:hypothetical protein
VHSIEGLAVQRRLSAHEAMSIDWQGSGQAFYGTATDAAGAVHFHLTIEMDGNGWIWSVWRPGEDRAGARRGRTATRHGAMWDAERVTLT